MISLVEGCGPGIEAPSGSHTKNLTSMELRCALYCPANALDLSRAAATRHKGSRRHSKAYGHRTSGLGFRAASSLGRLSGFGHRASSIERPRASGGFGFLATSGLGGFWLQVASVFGLWASSFGPCFAHCILMPSEMHPATVDPDLRRGRTDLQSSNGKLYRKY